MTHKSDVFVIGGGPAGLTAAIAARQKGFTVLVADGSKPPIDKPCGEGLMPDAIAALRELGVHVAASEGYPLRGITFRDAHSSATSTFPIDPGVGVRRTILHTKMLERAAALGVEFLWQTPVTGIEGHNVRLAVGTSANARWIVGADGGQSRVRRWAALEGSTRPDSRFACRAHFAVSPWSDAVEIYWADFSQAYVTPVSPTEVCVVIACEDSKVELRAALRHFPELEKKLATVPLSRPHRGTITTMRKLSRVCSGNIALIGDASGSVDAITGEGLSLSFQQAQALAEAIAADDLSRYQRAHRSLARRPTFMARLLLLLDGRPRLRRRTLSAFAQHPELFSRLTSIHVGETSPVHFVTTGAMLGWHFLAA
jgi:flavin-dependent dehydrogenase